MSYRSQTAGSEWQARIDSSAQEQGETMQFATATPFGALICKDAMRARINLKVAKNVP
jgi:hypothetical protein